MGRMRRKYAAVLTGGVVFLSAANCLPEEYFALSARNIAVFFADQILQATIVDPLLDALNLPDANVNNNTNTNDNAASG